MPTDDSTIKTSLRLPRRLHAELEAVAASFGLTLNAELLLRLQTDPRDNAAAAILEEMKRRDEGLANALLKQIAVLWDTLDRADDVLKRVASAMSKVSGEGDGAILRRDVEFARELIKAISATR